MDKISVVIPLYKCSQAINELSRRLINTLSSISEDFEIIFVNDASPENDWEIVVELSKKDERIKGVNFSRNFGQHYAITAGLVYAKGDWIVIMDGDLQDQPEEITKLVQKASEGFEIVFAQRKNRKDRILRRWLSSCFYWFFSYLTDTKQDASVGNFGVYSKKAIKAVLELKDSIRYFPTMIQWVGYKKTKVTVNHTERRSGKSSYSFSSLLQLAMNNIIAFSDKSLRLTVKIGFSITLLSLIFGMITLIRFLQNNIIVSGYTSLILSIWFLSGLIIAIIGIVGIYVGKVFEKVKDRPMFIVSEKINLE